MGEGEGSSALRCGRSGVGDMGEGEDAIEVSISGFETRQEGVMEAVVRRNEQDVALRTGRAIGPGLAGGKVSGQGEGEERGATARSAVEQGEFARRDATGPEPGEGMN